MDESSSTAFKEAAEKLSKFEVKEIEPQVIETIDNLNDAEDAKLARREARYAAQRMEQACPQVMMYRRNVFVSDRTPSLTRSGFQKIFFDGDRLGQSIYIPKTVGLYEFPVCVGEKLIFVGISNNNPRQLYAFRHDGQAWFDAAWKYQLPNWGEITGFEDLGDHFVLRYAIFNSSKDGRYDGPDLGVKRLKIRLAKG